MYLIDGWDISKVFLQLIFLIQSQAELLGLNMKMTVKDKNRLHGQQ